MRNLKDLKKKIMENETNYGQEIREKYGDDTVEKANKKWQNMSEEKFEEMQSLEKQLLADLTAYLQSDSDQKLALKLFEEHKNGLLLAGLLIVPKLIVA